MSRLQRNTPLASFFAFASGSSANKALAELPQMRYKVEADNDGLQEPNDDEEMADDEEELEQIHKAEDQLDHDEVLNILDDIFAGGSEAQETFRRCCALFAGW
ncbi:hypothetical protein B0T20DRAFT_390468 [Sordaria brevicollis]|uniref:Uncharacterized protein n=1 Tax=Sordaria brevicollis TaxID=83679 RepID=A0AAE0PIK0_SORBR|nr:hypothetical protein B0T20DRAFT_390468 [Sordaria brevicollis]